MGKYSEYTRKETVGDTDLILISEDDGSGGYTTVAIQAGKLGITSWEEINANSVASPGVGYVADTSTTDVGLELPSNPQVGWRVAFRVDVLDHPFTIMPYNTDQIEGSSSPVTIDIPNSSGLLVYTSGSGWVFATQSMTKDYIQKIARRNALIYG